MSFYLVKNGETIQDPYPDISKFENRILVDFYLEDLQIAIREMQNKKYSTEINDMNARQIINIHKKYCKSVKLQPIIQKVNRIISNKNVDINVTKEVDDMSVITLDERYCTIQESIIESFKEVKLIREGKLPKKSWKDFMNEHKEREENE